MERKGVYNKGHAGHPRNVGMYRLFRQKFKKWRGPLTALIALAIMVGTAPMVGNELSASTLTASDIAAIAKTNLAEARAVLGNSLATFSAECGRLKIDACKNEASGLAKEIGVTSSVAATAQKVEVLKTKFKPALAKAACVTDLAAAVANGNAVKVTVQKFEDQYGSAKENAPVAMHLEALKESMAGLELFVESCRAR